MKRFDGDALYDAILATYTKVENPKNDPVLAGQIRGARVAAEFGRFLANEANSDGSSPELMAKILAIIIAGEIANLSLNAAEPGKEELVAQHILGLVEQNVRDMLETAKTGGRVGGVRMAGVLHAKDREALN